jgi:hypothetical protein
LTVKRTKANATAVSGIAQRTIQKGDGTNMPICIAITPAIAITIKIAETTALFMA